MITILIILICLVLNAMLSAIEMAFVSVGKPELRQKTRSGDKKALELLRLRENPERTLSVLQIGITLVGAISAAVAGAGSDDYIAPYLQYTFNMNVKMSEVLSIAIVVLPLTYFSVVLGELVPKTFALRRPLYVSLNGLPLLKIGELIFSPLVSILESSTKRVVQFFSHAQGQNQHNEMLADQQQLDIAGLSSSHKELVLNLVKIETARAGDVMLPWDNVDTIQYKSRLSDVIATIVRCGHTRIPVLDGEEVKGVLHSKEFLSYLAASDENWQQIIRPPILITPQMLLLSLLRTMQSTKTHMAIVQKSNSPDTPVTSVGIVTLEDILEEIVGEIYDEDEDGRVMKILSQKTKEKQLRKG